MRSPWALILAGGDGTRLRPLTRQIAGDERPKQFCPVLSSETLFEETRRRVTLLTSPEHILAVVVLAHQRFYAPLLVDVPSRCMAIQPENRGTAPAILYGLLRLIAMAPPGPVAIFSRPGHRVARARPPRPALASSTRLRRASSAVL